MAADSHLGLESTIAAASATPRLRLYDPEVEAQRENYLARIQAVSRRYREAFERGCRVALQRVRARAPRRIAVPHRQRRGSCGRPRGRGKGSPSRSSRGDPADHSEGDHASASPSPAQLTAAPFGDGRRA